MAAEPDRLSFSCSTRPSAFSSPWYFSSGLSPWRAPLFCLPRRSLYLASFQLKSGFMKSGLSGGSLPSPLAKADVERPLAAMTRMRDLEAEHVAAEVRQLQP